MSHLASASLQFLLSVQSEADLFEWYRRPAEFAFGTLNSALALSSFAFCLAQWDVNMSVGSLSPRPTLGCHTNVSVACTVCTWHARPPVGLCSLGVYLALLHLAGSASNFHSVAVGLLICNLAHVFGSLPAHLHLG